MANWITRVRAVVSVLRRVVTGIDARLWSLCRRLALKSVPYSWTAFLIQVRFVILLALFWKCITPAPGIAVTILGAVAAIMAVRGPHFKRGEELVWIAVAVLLCYFEIQAIRLDRATSERNHLRELRTQETSIRRLIGDDHTLVSNTNALVGTIKSLVPQINTLDQQISTIKTQMAAAIGDPQQTAALKAQLNTVQNQYNAATQKLASTLAQVQGAPLPAPTPAELKAIGLQLAQDIQAWIATVSKEAPQPPPGIASSPDEDRKYVERLNVEWQTKFNYMANFLLHRLPIREHLNFACFPDIPYAQFGPSGALQLRQTCASAIERGAMELPTNSEGVQ